MHIVLKFSFLLFLFTISCAVFKKLKLILISPLGFPVQTNRSQYGDHGHHPSARGPRAQPMYGVPLTYPKNRAQNDFGIHCNYWRGFHCFEKLCKKKYLYAPPN
jgi:hypothetical protein